jgi:hypothetical protein
LGAPQTGARSMTVRGVYADGIAETEADPCMKCPGCSGAHNAYAWHSVRRPHETVPAGSERTPDAGHVTQAVSIKYRIHRFIASLLPASHPPRPSTDLRAKRLPKEKRNPPA